MRVAGKVGASGRASRLRRRGLAIGVALALPAMAVAGCGAGTKAPTLNLGVAPQADIELTPAAGVKAGSTKDPVVVKATNGTLEGIRITDDQNRELAGDFDTANTSWKSTGTVTPDSTYRVETLVRGKNGLTVDIVRSFHTAMPAKVLKASVSPSNTQTYGVGMPIAVTFNVPIKNKDKADIERRLEVQTSEPVTGAWHWFGDREVHYRPKTYWPEHTNVDLKLNLHGADSGNGAWGVEDVTHKVRYGRSVVTDVNLFSHYAKTYIDGKLARTIPVSGGKPGWRTRNGTKVVLEKRTDIHFTNTQIGAAETYSLYAPYGLRVTWSGEFLHTASWSVGSQGYANTSHGCVGMNYSNSQWLWENSSVGDPVQVHSSGDQMAVTGNGWGDWNLSWAKWKAGSALRNQPKDKAGDHEAQQPRADLTVAQDQDFPTPPSMIDASGSLSR